MSFSRYKRYKDSGKEWLGLVPEHWDVTPLKYAASLKGRLGWQGLRADEYTEEGPFLVTSEHFTNEAIDWGRCYHVSPERYALAPEIHLRADDLLMMKDGAAMGKLAYVESVPGPACLNSHLLLFRPVNGRFANRFLFYLLGGPSFRTYMIRERTGTTFFGISQESIGAFSVALPPIDEQRLILQFLAREISKIDALIGEQKRLIGLLREKRQAVISHAVMKGLNPAVLMKDSGIEWLGKVPEHWGVIAVRRVIRKIEQGWSPECMNRPAEGDEWGVLKSGCVNRGTFNENENKALPDHLVPFEEYEVKAGDVLMSRASGSSDLIGSTALVEQARSRLMLSDKIFRLHLLQRMNSRYFVLLFNSRPLRTQIEQSISGADGLANNLPQSSIKCFLMALPPVLEQADIVAFLDAEIARLDSLSAEAENAVTLLQERRTALISAVVTGKIDVRGFVAGRPENEADE